METDPQEEIYGDPGLAARITEVAPTETVSTRSIMFDARDIVMGGVDLLRRHPVGSIEVGGAIAATGVALGALIVPRLRHAH